MTVLKFSAPWCGPCKQIAPIAATAASTNPDRVYMEIDVDEYPDIADAWGIQGVPTIITLDDEYQMVDRKVGLQAASLLR